MNFIKISGTVISNPRRRKQFAWCHLHAPLQIKGYIVYQDLRFKVVARGELAFELKRYKPLSEIQVAGTLMLSPDGGLQILADRILSAAEVPNIVPFGRSKTQEDGEF